MAARWSCNLQNSLAWPWRWCLVFLGDMMTLSKEDDLWDCLCPTGQQCGSAASISWASNNTEAWLLMSGQLVKTLWTSCEIGSVPGPQLLLSFLLGQWTVLGRDTTRPFKGSTSGPYKRASLWRPVSYQLSMSIQSDHKICSHNERTVKPVS